MSSLRTSALIAHIGFFLVQLNLAHALDSQINTTQIRYINTCEVTLTHDGPGGNASVVLSGVYGGTYAPPKIYVFSISGDAVFSGHNPITGTAIRECIGNSYGGATTSDLPDANIDIVSAGSDFAADTHLGFAFTMANTIGDFNAGVTYSYFVGTPPDTMPPDPPTLSIYDESNTIVQNGGTTNDMNLTISGSAEANSTVSLKNGTNTVDSNISVNSDGNWSKSLSNLDFGTHSFTATATDSASNTSAASAAYSVTVNAGPVIINNSYQSTNSVSAAENQTSVVTILGSDDINGTSELDYGISGGVDKDYFSIGMNTGVLVFKAAPDFETPADADHKNTYEVQVSVTDSGGLSATQDVTVTVTDVVEDTTEPTVLSIERKSPATQITDADSLQFEVTFSEPVQNVDEELFFADSNIQGLTTSVAGSNDVYTVTITGADLADANADVCLIIAYSNPSQNVQDLSGNDLVYSNQSPNECFKVSNDISGPNVTISGVPGTITNTDPFTVTYDFGENVLGFELADVTAALTNATAGSLTTVTKDSKFTVSITPDGSGDVSVGLKADAVTDTNQNGNAAATAQVAKNNIVEETQKLVSDFIQNRRSTLANIQPNIGGFIDGTGFSGGGGPLGNLNLNSFNTNSFNLAFTSSLGRIWGEMERNERNALSLRMAPQAGQQSYGLSGLSDTDGAATSQDTYENARDVEAGKKLTPAQRRGYDMWVQLYGAYSEAGDSESTIWVGYVGGHKHISPNLLIGAFGQLDWSDESNSANGTSGDGMGWMIGPYMAAKLPDQNLYFDARAAWGRSNNDFTQPSSTGSFDTERWLVSGKVSGMFKADKITIRPAVSVSYYEETQEAFTDSLGNPIGEQTFTQGEVRFGPTFSVDHKLDDGTTLRPHFGTSGVWNFAVDNGASSQGAVLGTGDFRARLDVGFTATAANGWSLNMNGFYDGIGIDNFFSYGGRARVTLPLN